MDKEMSDAVIKWLHQCPVDYQIVDLLDDELNMQLINPYSQDQ